ncbi:phospholipase A [Psychrosphaera algicola]|uniref:Phospholipase A1 n=1 Tax=Psychrosphaera algicola TaxID=3023714 RepID=A0ABT5FBD9_9GAMM|nr:phospholipase A [Psychrosphaera sp. G1-22]MDC2888454.1 phospholipase A [Psychrosphaera sp. G1-22]
MRIINEKATEFNPFVITPHKHSYIMPVSYSDNFNSEAYSEVGTNIDHMKNYEAKYQISLKVPLFTSDIFVPRDSLYFGMTIQAWWQLYSEKLSRPFRETNYQPEIFYQAPLPFKPFGGNMGFELGIEHQSNGQSQLLSRSWNRIKFGILYERGDHFVAFRPWYRLPEGDKEDPLSPIGDDNPDIEDYMGHYTIDAAYAFSDTRKIAVMIRKNWRTGNGAIEINFTKPIFGRMIGLVQYFSGYGESLIDYNHKQQKIGFGIALTEIF